MLVWYGLAVDSYVVAVLEVPHPTNSYPSLAVAVNVALAVSEALEEVMLALSTEADAEP
jgi:uncharacterized protein YcnI